MTACLARHRPGCRHWPAPTPCHHVLLLLQLLWQLTPCHPQYHLQLPLLPVPEQGQQQQGRAQQGVPP